MGNGEDILRLLKNTLNKRGAPVLLTEEIARFPSLFEDAPEYLRHDFDFALLAFGNADRAIARCLVNEFGRASSLYFRDEVQERLMAHASFSKGFLPCMWLPTGSPVSHLNQGQATSMAFMTCIAKFNGAPTTFDELRLLRRALENLEKMRLLASERPG